LEEARKYVEKANQEYLHWEKAKYLSGSASISPEELWFLIKLSRISIQSRSRPGTMLCCLASPLIVPSPAR